MTFNNAPQTLNVPKPWSCQNIDCTKTLTTPKHRPWQNINSAKILTTPKHQLFQNIDHAEVDWPKSPASLLIQCLTVIIDNLVRPGRWTVPVQKCAYYHAPVGSSLLLSIWESFLSIIGPETLKIFGVIFINPHNLIIA